MGLRAPVPGLVRVDSLISRIPGAGVKEVILALSATMEGDTTAFYITKKLRQFEGVKVSTIARGVPVGGELEYTDEVTLGRSIVGRVSYE